MSTFGVTFGDFQTGGGGGGVTPPSIINMFPVPGAAVGSANGFSADWRIARVTAITFDVICSDSRLIVPVIARFGDPLGVRNPTYVVYDGVQFLPPFKQGSTITVISGGYHFSVLMDNGWLPQPIHFDILAVDGVPS